MRFSLFLVAVTAIVVHVGGQCSNLCSNSGQCYGNNQCLCYPGYTGRNCEYNNCAKFIIQGSGNNMYGGLGNGAGDWIAYPYGPLKGGNVFPYSNFSAVCVGNDFAIVVDKSGTLYTFGSNQNGMLGIGKLFRYIFHFTKPTCRIDQFKDCSTKI